MDSRIDNIQKTVRKYTNLDFSEKIEHDNSGDAIASIAASVNILAQKLKDAIAAAQQLEEQQMLFTSIVGLCDDAIISKDLNGNITTWNNGAEKIFGYKSNEVVGKHISILIPPALQNEELTIMQKIKNGQNADHYETDRLTKEGKIIHVSLTVSPVKDLQGNIIGASKILRDITRRTLAEEGFEKVSREVMDYKYALDESAIVAITDQKGIINYVNDNFCRISKYSRNELIGQDHRIVSSGYHSKEFIRNLWTTIANGQIWRGELKNKAKDNTFYWVDTTIVPFVNEQNKPWQYVAIRSDITKRKKAEEELLKSNRRYSFLSAINKSIAHLTDEQTLLTTVCSIAVTTGKFASARLGLLDQAGRLNLVAADNSKVNEHELQRYSGTDFSSHLLRETRTGKVLSTGNYAVSNDAQNDPGLAPWKEELISTGVFSCAGFPIKKFGKITGVFSILSSEKDFFDDREIALLQESAGDISFALEVFENDKMRKAAESEIKLLNETLEARIAERTLQLQDANKELESFSYSVAHDLRSPLRGVLGYATILKEDYNALLDDEGKRILGEVEFNTKKMGTLIDDLLTFSKIGRKEINKAPVNMNVVVASSLNDIEKAQQHKARVNVAKLHSVLADASLIKHVVINLLSNAIKYSSKSEHPVVEIKSEADDGNIIYSVSDNGVGFDMEYAGKLFGVFQRLHTDDEFEGTGVGLAIAQRIIHKHGGRIWAQSKEGEGATFYFSLPQLINKTQ